MDLETRDSVTLTSFKYNLRKRKTPRNPKSFYHEVIYRMPFLLGRYNCSSLNEDLFRVNIVPPQGTTVVLLLKMHNTIYFFESRLLNMQRKRLILSHNIIPNINIDLIFHDKRKYAADTNTTV